MLLQRGFEITCGFGGRAEARNSKFEGTVALEVVLAEVVVVAVGGRSGGGAMLLQGGFEITCGCGGRAEGGCYFNGALK